MRTKSGLAEAIQPALLFDRLITRSLCREQSLLSISQERYVPPYSMAIVHLGLGQRDVPLNFLPIDPKWDSFRSDLHFCSLLERCGFPNGPQPR